MEKEYRDQPELEKLHNLEDEHRELMKSHEDEIRRSCIYLRRTANILDAVGSHEIAENLTLISNDLKESFMNLKDKDSKVLRQKLNANKESFGNMFSAVLRLSDKENQ